MNELEKKTDAGTGTGKPPASPVATSAPGDAPGNAPARISATPPLPSVPIGKPGYKFKFPVESPQGQEERREHERLRKSDRRAAARPLEPPPLPVPSVPDQVSTSPGEQSPGVPVAVAEMVVPWTPEDVKDFTDELVDLTEAKRISDFVALAREASLPPKLIAEIEKDARYPTSSKASLKRAVSGCVAKWLNKTGISSRNKEEAALLFCVITIKLQGMRLRSRLASLVEADKKTPDPKADKRGTANPTPFAVVK